MCLLITVTPYKINVFIVRKISPRLLIIIKQKKNVTANYRNQNRSKHEAGSPHYLFFSYHLFFLNFYCNTLSTSTRYLLYLLKKKEGKPHREEKKIYT